MGSLVDDLAENRLPAPQVCKAIRRAAHATQAQVAAELGVHVMTVARWEQGRRQPAPELRKRYRALLSQLEAVGE
jgi:DNA-binding transcriptional regulator YiaG